MQYTAWPDHGVPSDQKYFIEFVDEVCNVSYRFLRNKPLLEYYFKIL